jgi:hypothetical protein
MDLELLRWQIIGLDTPTDHPEDDAASAAARCAGCGAPIENLDEAHWGHEPDCGQQDRGWCRCDLFYHPHCCPECRLKDLCSGVAA